MTILLIFAFAAFALFALYRMLAPFLASERDQTRYEVLHEEISRIEQLLARRQVLLRSLRDLEFEYETSKIAEDDYARFKRIFELEAVGVMRQLDAIHGGRGWEAQIDEELVRRLGRQRDVAADDEARDEAADEEDDAPRLESAGPAASSCITCQADLAADDRFCRQCGTPVTGPEPEHDPEPRPAREVGR